jgi:hypothetical protein
VSAESQPARAAPARVRRLLAVGAALAVLALAASFGLRLPRVSAADGCAGPLSLRYSTARPAAATDPPAVVVSSIELPCAEAPVVVVLKGNAAGDPAQPATVLSTVDSTRDPCTGEPVDLPAGAGTLTLRLCPAGGTARIVPVHDLTRIEVSSGGDVVVSPGPSSGTPSPRVLGAVVTRSNPSPASTPGALPWTGFDVAVTFVAGASALVVGAVLVAGSRRRRPLR